MIFFDKKKDKENKTEAPVSPKKLKKKGEVEKEAKSAEPKKKKPERKLPQKNKDDVYPMKKNTKLKVMRAVFWLILIFVFGRGLYQIVRPQKEAELRSLIETFKQEQQLIGDAPEEVMNFAENFAKEYLTYKHSGEQDFKKRIEPYVTKRIYNMANIYSFKHAARATYVNAYRKEGQNGAYDVYVNAEVAYDRGDQGIEYGSCTLKIPVQVSESGYCVVALPLYVQDNRLDTTYTLPETAFGSEIDNTKITPAVSNFLEAYYEQDQSMINYLLTSDADKGNFIGISKRYTFRKIENLKAYQDVTTNAIRCIVKIRILDSVNEEEIYQELNLTLIEKDDKYYVKDINTKITGLQ